MSSLYFGSLHRVSVHSYSNVCCLWRLTCQPATCAKTELQGIFTQPDMIDHHVSTVAQEGRQERALTAERAFAFEGEVNLQSTDSPIDGKSPTSSFNNLKMDPKIFGSPLYYFDVMHEDLL